MGLLRRSPVCRQSLLGRPAARHQLIAVVHVELAVTSQQTERRLRTFTSRAGRPQADHHGKLAAVTRRRSGNDASRSNSQAVANNARSFAAATDTEFLVQRIQLRWRRCQSASAAPAAGAAAGATPAAPPRLAAARRQDPDPQVLAAGAMHRWTLRHAKPRQAASATLDGSVMPELGMQCLSCKPRSRRRRVASKLIGSCIGMLWRETRSGGMQSAHRQQHLLVLLPIQSKHVCP